MPAIGIAVAHSSIMQDKELSFPPVVVITGGSAGVGRATAIEFAKQRAKIGLIARGREGLEAARSEVEPLGGKAVIYCADVSQSDQVEQAAQFFEEKLGPIDIWVNNAMVSVFSPIREMSTEEFRRVTEVTYLGYVHGTLAALHRMYPRNRGLIIQVGSALAYRSIPGQSAYCAAKHAINGFTEALRTELLSERSRIQVVQIHLPAVNTPQFTWVKSRLPRKPQPVPPIFQPEVPAKAIVWAAAHPRREIWLGYPTVKAILADKFFPGLADRYLAKKGLQSQQTAEPADPNRLNNLWRPLPGDYGAHGAFDHRAKQWSWQFWLNRHRRSIFSLGILYFIFSFFRNSEKSGKPLNSLKKAA